MIVIESMQQLRDMVRVIMEEGRGEAAISEPMTPEQLSKASGMHADTIRKGVRNGSIKRIPHTARILIPARECERIISGR